MSQMMKAEELRPCARNSYFFDDIAGEAWEEFKRSIETSGIIEPLIISPDKVVVSGHQRLRAARELGITEVPVEVRLFNSPDELIKQLIETNIRQRGLGNGNPVKLGRCLKELERIAGVRDGSTNKPGDNRIGEPQNAVHAKTQADLAKELGMSVDKIQRYKALASSSPGIQEAIEEGKITPTTALKIIRGLSQEEQEALADQLTGARYTGAQIREMADELASNRKDMESLRQSLEEEKAKKAEVKEIVKEVVVPPADYEQAKLDAVGYAAAYDGEREMREELEEELNRLKAEGSASTSDDDIDAFVFAQKCKDFISEIRPYVLEADEIASLGSRARMRYMNGLSLLAEWANITLEDARRPPEDGEGGQAGMGGTPSDGAAAKRRALEEWKASQSWTPQIDVDG